MPPQMAQSPVFRQSLIGCPAASVIRDLYGGTMVNVVQCLECANLSRRPEPFHDLSIPVKGMAGLEAG